MLGDEGDAKEVKVQMENPKLKTKLSEYDTRDRTDGPYRDNLETDALIVGGGFAGVFMFWSLKKEGLDVTMYEAGDGYGGTWRWNCYRMLSNSDLPVWLLTSFSWSNGGLRSPGISALNSRSHSSVCIRSTNE